MNSLFIKYFCKSAITVFFHITIVSTSYPDLSYKPDTFPQITLIFSVHVNYLDISSILVVFQHKTYSMYIYTCCAFLKIVVLFQVNCNPLSFLQMISFVFHVRWPSYFLQSHRLKKNKMLFCFEAIPIRCRLSNIPAILLTCINLIPVFHRGFTKNIFFSEFRNSFSKLQIVFVQISHFVVQIAIEQSFQPTSISFKCLLSSNSNWTQQQVKPI